MEQMKQQLLWNQLQSVNKPWKIIFYLKYFVYKYLVALPTAAYVEAWVSSSWLQECRRILKENVLGTWKVCQLLYFLFVCKPQLHKTVTVVSLRLCIEWSDTHKLPQRCKMWSILISVLEGKFNCWAGQRPDIIKMKVLDKWVSKMYMYILQHLFHWYRSMDEKSSCKLLFWFLAGCFLSYCCLLVVGRTIIS
jgi:hypothetical protein